MIRMRAVLLIPAFLGLLIGCIQERNRELEIQTFEAAINPVPNGTAPTLKGSWDFKASGYDSSVTAVIEATDRSWGIAHLGSPFQVQAIAVTVPTTYTLTVRSERSASKLGPRYHAQQSRSCRVDVTPQATTVAPPLGEFLVVGGKHGDCLREPSARVDRWSATGGWRTTTPLQLARKAPVVTLLPDGKVKVAGGFAPTGLPIMLEEVYDPATEQWTLHEPPAPMAVEPGTQGPE